MARHAVRGALAERARAAMAVSIAEERQKKILEVVAKLAQEHGKSFLKYDIDPQGKVNAAKVDPEKLVKQADRLAKLVAVSRNFKKSELTSALREVVTNNRAKWSMSEEHLSDWVWTMDLRIRTMLGQISDAARQKKPPKWVQKIPWLQDPWSDKYKPTNRYPPKQPGKNNPMAGCGGDGLSWCIFHS